MGVGGAHRPTPSLPNIGCPGIPRAALGQRPGSVGHTQGPRGHIQLWEGSLSLGPESRAGQGHGGLDPISLCVGPGGLKSPQPHRARGQASPCPSGLGAVSYAGCAALQEGQWVEAGHSGSSAPLTCTHPVWGSLPSLLPATPGYSMGNPVF